MAKGRLSWRVCLGLSFGYLFVIFICGIFVGLIDILLSDNYAAFYSFPLIVLNYILGAMIFYLLGMVIVCIAVLWMTRSILKSLIPLILIVPIVVYAWIQGPLAHQEELQAEVVAGQQEQANIDQENLQMKQESDLTQFTCGTENIATTTEYSYIEVANDPLSPTSTLDVFYEGGTQEYPDPVLQTIDAKVLLGYVISTSSKEYIPIQAIPSQYGKLFFNGTPAEYASKLSTCKNLDGQTFSQIYAASSTATVSDQKLVTEIYSGTELLTAPGDFKYYNLEFAVTYVYPKNLGMTVIDHSLEQSSTVSMTVNQPQTIDGYTMTVTGIQQLETTNALGQITTSNEATLTFMLQ